MFLSVFWLLTFVNPSTSFTRFEIYMFFFLVFLFFFSDLDKAYKYTIGIVAFNSAGSSPKTNLSIPPQLGKIKVGYHYGFNFLWYTTNLKFVHIWKCNCLWCRNMKSKTKAQTRRPEYLESLSPLHV